MNSPDRKPWGMSNVSCLTHICQEACEKGGQNWKKIKIIIIIIIFLAYLAWNQKITQKKKKKNHKKEKTQDSIRCFKSIGK